MAKDGLELESNVPSTTKEARAKRKRRLMLKLPLITFVALVVIPSILSVYYLFFVAENRYASQTAFSVRSLDMQSSVDILGMLQGSSGSNSAATSCCAFSSSLIPRQSSTKAGRPCTMKIDRPSGP